MSEEFHAQPVKPDEHDDNKAPSRENLNVVFIVFDPIEHYISCVRHDQFWEEGCIGTDHPKAETKQDESVPKQLMHVVRLVLSFFYLLRDGQSALLLEGRLLCCPLLHDRLRGCKRLANFLELQRRHGSFLIRFVRVPKLVAAQIRVGEGLRAARLLH